MRWHAKRTGKVLVLTVVAVFIIIESQIYVFTDRVQEHIDIAFLPKDGDPGVALNHPDHDHVIKIGDRFHNHGAQGGGDNIVMDKEQEKPEDEKKPESKGQDKQPLLGHDPNLMHKLDSQFPEVPAGTSVYYDTSLDSSPRLYHDSEVDEDDRIVSQMKYKNPSVDSKTKHKTLLVWTGIQHWEREGQAMFIRDKCPMQACTVTSDRSQAGTADAILFQHSMAVPNHKRPPNQVWIMYFLESPYHTPGLDSLKGVFNWTSTYRHDSTIVAPYEKFVPYNASVRFKKQNKNYAAGKTKKVAWFVSNCGARNRRLEYAKELGKHIEVDIYGHCGPLKCPRFQANDCFTKLDKEYKFYLAFENSNCWDYMTEKFFVNGLQHDVLPIVMGGRPGDYRRQAPPNSFLHVDDFESVEALAKYLHVLDKDDELFNRYFQWKGTGEFVNTFWWCRACAMLHAPSPTPHIVEDPELFWRGGKCVGTDSWREHGYVPQTPLQSRTKR